jgi:hypothetical protein
MMTRKVKIHDGIIGALLVASAGLAVAVDPRFVWLTALTGLIMLSSAFTGSARSTSWWARRCRGAMTRR